MVKVLHLISSLDTGGAEIQLAELLTRMDGNGFQHCVVSLLKIGPIGEMMRDQGHSVESLGMRPSVPSPPAIWKLWRIIRLKQPQILQTWMYHADLLGLVVGKLARVPAIAWNIRCSHLDMRHYPKLSEVVVRTLSRLSSIPDVVLANSEAGREAHSRIGYHARRFEVIPNGFNLDRFRPDKSARESVLRELDLPADSIIVGLVARYDPMKDHQLFLYAIKKIHARYPHTRFILCGSNVDRNNSLLTGQIELHGLTACVRLLGLRKDIPRITAAFDIACSSSYGEGFSNAIGEAMATGVPCVATDVGDSAKIVGTTGKIVPPKNVDNFVKALSELIELGTEGRRVLGLKARSTIAENFSIDAIALRYEQLYRSLASFAANTTCVE